jgi:hypothetical protein
LIFQNGSELRTRNIYDWFGAKLLEMLEISKQFVDAVATLELAQPLIFEAGA